MPALIMSRAADPCQYLTLQAFWGSEEPQTCSEVCSVTTRSPWFTIYSPQHKLLVGRRERSEDILGGTVGGMMSHRFCWGFSLRWTDHLSTLLATPEARSMLSVQQCLNHHTEDGFWEADVERSTPLQCCSGCHWEVIPVFGEIRAESQHKAHSGREDENVNFGFIYTTRLINKEPSCQQMSSPAVRHEPLMQCSTSCWLTKVREVEVGSCQLLLHAHPWSFKSLSSRIKRWLPGNSEVIMIFFSPSRLQTMLSILRRFCFALMYFVSLKMGTINVFYTICCKTIVIISTYLVALMP